MNKHTLLVAAASMSVLSSAAMAQAVVVAIGVPQVGIAAGGSCTQVKVGDATLVVPNSLVYSGQLLTALSAAEFRGQSIQAVNDGTVAQCYGTLAGTGYTMTQLDSYR